MTHRLLISAIGLGLGLIGCDRSPRNTTSDDNGRDDGVVIVYTALDRQFSEPILRRFTEQTGIRAEAVYDTESTKTVGLVNRIRSEANRPRCDVFWNNEILNTLRLKSEGLLQPCRPPEANNYPQEYRDEESYWFGFAARARVILVNTDLVVPTDYPTSVRDLGAPRFRGRAGIAKPLFGTTASHVAALFALLGEAKARSLLDTFLSNDIQVVAGNKSCAQMVGAGRLALGLTDTDDAISEIEAGKPVTIIFPDIGPDQMGTLLLPNTLALVKGGPHPAAGGKLIDYLLSAEIEAQLAAGPSAQIPLHKAVKTQSRVLNGGGFRPMAVDYQQASVEFDRAIRYIEDAFLVQ